MTVVVTVKISEGIVVASDSASSLMDGNNRVVNIYNNANKIVNLHKGLPVGAMACGAGSIGNLSISTIFKDFRDLLHEDDKSKEYTIKQFSDKLFNYLKNDHYDAKYNPGDPNNPLLMVWVFGYSPKEQLPEIWQFSMKDVHKDPIEAILRSESGLNCGGDPELCMRVAMGYGQTVPKKLEELGVDKQIINQVITATQQAHPLVNPAMPIQDAIDLADFLARSTVEFSRFKLGAATVGGPVEVAAITKHEGFKWIKRKHYFDVSLNR